MKLIKPSFEIFEQGPGLQGIYEAIERAGRTCYKSQAKYQYRNPHTDEVYAPDFVGTWKVDDDRIGVTTTAEDFYRKEGIFIKESSTAKGFVDRMITSQHYAMLEHGTVYLAISHNPFSSIGDSTFRYRDNPYSKVINALPTKPSITYITTNYRVLVENGWLDDLKYLCEPTEYHEKRVTVRFTTDRGVSHEFVRHRVFSFAQESTRYCNYSKDKFGNELTFIIPSWIDSIEPGTYEEDHKFPPMWGHDHWMEDIWFHSMARCEEDYITMVREYLTPQMARQILPNSLKTELVMTGFVSDWRHFFRLRTSVLAETGKPHPDASTLADPLYKEFIDRGYMESLV